MTYASAIPANYDASSFNIDPGGLNSAAQSIQASVQDIANYLSAVNATLSNLKLSWAGSSSQAASQYNEEWNKAVQAIFGTQSDPDSGALAILTNGLASAAQNYSSNEAAIAGMFNSFASGFSSPAAPSPTAIQSAPQAKPAGLQSTTNDPTDLIDGGPEGLYNTTSVNESF
jgi:uncharacterized protein YukE